MGGDVGEPALRALHGPQNFLKSRYPPLWLVWEMENETVKNWGVAVGHAVSSATKVLNRMVAIEHEAPKYFGFARKMWCGEVAAT